MEPSSAGGADDPDGDATGLDGASVGVAVGLTTGSGDEVGPSDDDDDVGDADEVSAMMTVSSIAPAGNAVVDEHPATAAVTSTNPMVSSFIRVLIAYPFHDGDAIHPAGVGLTITRNGSPKREDVYEGLEDPVGHTGAKHVKAG